ncbi:MAG: Clp protease N-terminal domain-containing protein [bacterium]
MIRKFTERARKVISTAEKEAERLKDNYIGTEHLLLALAAEDGGIAIHALSNIGVNAKDMRRSLEEAIRIERMSQDEYERRGRRTFTAQARAALKRAISESRALGHRYVGTEHILLALVDEENSTAARILQEFGANEEAIRREIANLGEGRHPVLPS